MRLTRFILGLFFSFVAATSLASQRFPIGMWWGPPVEHNDLATWQMVKDAGFNFIGQSRSPYPPEELQRQLNFAHALDLNVMLYDGRLNSHSVGQPGWREQVRDAVEAVREHPALASYYLYDEPSAAQFSSLAELQREIALYDSTHPTYLCLFPNYASAAQLGSFTYEEYLQRFIRDTQPTILSYDHYPVMTPGSDYYANLEVTRAAAIHSRVANWPVIQGLNWGSRAALQSGELRGQVYTSLAYGAKGLLYFFYWPLSDVSAFGRGLVDQSGRPQAEYFMIQAINREIEWLAPLLANAQSVGVFHTMPITPGTQALPSSLVTFNAGASAVVGTFRDAGDQKLIMIVNRNWQAAQTLQVILAPTVFRVERASAVTGVYENVPLSHNAFSLSLAAGQGALLRLIDQHTSHTLDFPNSEMPAATIPTHGLSPLTETVDGLVATITGGDPYLSFFNLAWSTTVGDRLVIRMQLPQARRAQIFWTTERESGFNDARHIEVDLPASEGMVEHVVRIGQEPSWTQGGRVTGLRLDPVRGNEADGQVMLLDLIRLDQ